MALLDVQNLSVQLQTQRGPAKAVRALSFSLEKGQTLGLNLLGDGMRDVLDPRLARKR